MFHEETIIVAHCGLVCSYCGMYLKGKCAGCHSDKPMNRNCKMKACSIERGYKNCAECTEFDNLKNCTKLNNFIANFFGFIFRTNRIGNLNRIREIGIEAFIEEKKKEKRP